MFSWLSLTETRRKCKTVTDLDSFKTKEVEETVKFFCKSQTFVPKFSVTDPLKTHGAPTVTAAPMIVSEDDLVTGIDQLRRFIFLVNSSLKTKLFLELALSGSSLELLSEG